jgi:hypothetical protein
MTSASPASTDTITAASPTLTNEALSQARPPTAPPTGLNASETEAALSGNNLGFTRTFAAILDERNKEDLKSDFRAPDDFPDEIWSSFEEAKQAIERYCADTTTCGGGFAIKIDSGKIAMSAGATKGPRKLIRCVCHGKPRSNPDRSSMTRPCQKSVKSGCNWGVWIEKASEGWVRSIFNEYTRIHGIQCHSHVLAQTEAQQAQFPSLREIPEDLLKIAKTWHLGGMKNSTIYHKLCLLADERQQTVLFTVKDIENLFRSNPADRSLDCNDLYKYFQHRVASNHMLRFEIDINKEGQLDKLFFVANQEAYGVWAETGGSVLLFDTKHGTNRYGLKLGLLSCIDHNCYTQVLAASFVESEDAESFSWVFAQFEAAFGSSPKVVFTDSDKSMEAALATTWKQSTHLLCTYHLWKNFHKHIRNVIQDEGHWRTISNRWWRLCKESDRAMQDEFSDQWTELVGLIEGGATSVEAFQKQQAWLKSMFDRKSQWAACHTWTHNTYGIHSTARAEALHSSVRHFCTKHSSAIAIVKDIEVMCR